MTPRTTEGNTWRNIWVAVLATPLASALFANRIFPERQPEEDPATVAAQIELIKSCDEYFSRRSEGAKNEP